MIADQPDFPRIRGDPHASLRMVCAKQADTLDISRTIQRHDCTHGKIHLLKQRFGDSSVHAHSLLCPVPDALSIKRLFRAEHNPYGIFLFFCKKKTA